MPGHALLQGSIITEQITLLTTEKRSHTAHASMKGCEVAEDLSISWEHRQVRQIPVETVLNYSQTRLLLA